MSRAMRALNWGRRAHDRPERLRSAIDTLPHPNKQIALLALVENKSIAEIAVDTQIHEDEVEALWNATVPLLQRRLALDR